MTPELRPQWQQERGERYGNRRKQVASLKRKDRHIERARNKRDAEKEIKE